MRMKSLAQYLDVLKCLIVVVGTAFIGGCGLSGVAFRDTNPVIVDYAQTVPFAIHPITNIFATTASRRLAIVQKSDKGIVVCAEPSPDVGEAFASAISANLKAPVTGVTAGPEVNAQLGRNVATQIAPLLYRSQGLQLYREYLYKLCIDRMNGWIDPKDYTKERSDAFTNAAALIRAEFSTFNNTVGVAFQNGRAGNAAVINPTLQSSETLPSQPTAPQPSVPLPAAPQPSTPQSSAP